MQLVPAEGPAAIRDSLSDEERALVVLRVDRRMEWEDIARVLSPEIAGAAVDLAAAPGAIERCFRALCDEIRARAVAAGLVGETGVDP